MKTRTMYMHTMDGRPASFDEQGGWLYFVDSCARSNATLVPTLRQVRREQRIARENTFDIPRKPRYDYVRVAIPIEH